MSQLFRRISGSWVALLGVHTPRVLALTGAASSTTRTTAAFSTPLSDSIPDSTVHNVALAPGTYGFPDATNTGPSGTLQRIPADISAGTGWNWDTRGFVYVGGNGSGNVVLENFTVGGGLSIDAHGQHVIIRNGRVSFAGEGFGIGIRDAASVLIQDLEITSPGSRLLVAVKDVLGNCPDIAVLRCNVSNVSTGIQIDSGLIKDCYIHDMGILGEDHINGTTSNYNLAPLEIAHNTIFNSFPQTDCISLFQDFGGQKDAYIHDNLLAGGGYTIYGGNGPVMPTNIRISKNRFSKKYHPTGGYFGVITAWNPAGAGNVISGNFWDEDGTAVTG